MTPEEVHGAMKDCHWWNEDQFRLELPGCDHHVGTPEVVSHKQQRFTGRDGKSVAEAVTEVEAGRVTAFPETRGGVARQQDLFFTHRNQLRPYRPKKQIELGLGRFIVPGHQHHRAFHHGGG